MNNKISAYILLMITLIFPIMSKADMTVGYGISIGQMHGKKFPINEFNVGYFYEKERNLQYGTELSFIKISRDYSEQGTDVLMGGPTIFAPLTVYRSPDLKVTTKYQGSNLLGVAKYEFFKNNWVTLKAGLNYATLQRDDTLTHAEPSRSKEITMRRNMIRPVLGLGWEYHFTKSASISGNVYALRGKLIATPDNGQAGYEFNDRLRDNISFQYSFG